MRSLYTWTDQLGREQNGQIVHLLTFSGSRPPFQRMFYCA